MTAPSPAAAPVSAWNIANALTVLRMVLVPVFLVVLFHDDGEDSAWRVLAFAIFALASVTDRIDGEIARKRGLVTDFGKIADPIADKALIGAALIGLSLLDELPWWVTVIVLVREVGVTLLRFFVIRHGVMPASRGGKVKTLLQALGIGLLILPLGGVPGRRRAADHVRRRHRHRGDRRRLRRPRGAAAADVRAHRAQAGPPRAAAVTEAVAREVHELLLAAAADPRCRGVAHRRGPGCGDHRRTRRLGDLSRRCHRLRHRAEGPLLGVDADLLAQRGPVDAEVAAAMADGVRARLAATYGLATTGVAGPDPQDGHPPGEVHVAVAGPEGVRAVRLDLAGDRAEVRAAGVHAALVLLRDTLLDGRERNAMITALHSTTPPHRIRWEPAERSARQGGRPR